jgi:hypothetical protein
VTGVSTLISRVKVRLGRYGGSYDDKARFWRDRLRSDYFAHTLGPEQVAKSESLARALVEYAADTTSLHEIGVGGGRNILYLLRALPDLQVSGNDLDREHTFKFMDPAVREALDFTQQDTLSFLRDAVSSGRQVDALLTSDHLIHLPPEAIPEVLDLLQRHARRTILFHEGVRRSPTRTDDFWWAHDYAALERDFEVVHEEQPTDERFAEYVLRVYRRRGAD